MQKICFSSYEAPKLGVASINYLQLKICFNYHMQLNQQNWIELVKSVWHMLHVKGLSKLKETKLFKTHLLQQSSIYFLIR